MDPSSVQDEPPRLTDAFELKIASTHKEIQGVSVPLAASELAWNCEKQAPPTSAAALPEAVWVAVWDKVEERLAADIEVRRKMDSLVLDGEQDCPIGCCVGCYTGSSDYEDYRDGYWKTKAKFEAEITTGWAQLEEELVQMLGDTVRCKRLEQKQMKVIGNRPAYTATSLDKYEASLPIGVRVEPKEDATEGDDSGADSSATAKIKPEVIARE